MKKQALIALALCVVSSALSGQAFRVRDIVDMSHIGYDDGVSQIKVENVFLYNATPKLVPEFRFALVNTDYGTDADSRTRLLFQLGSVVLFGPNVYGEFVYGIWLNGDDTMAQEGFAEINRESDSMHASLRLKAGYDHGTDVFYLIPDASFKYRFNPLYAAKAKYFFGYNTDSFASHSLQIENGFTFRERYTAVAITTGILETVAGDTATLWSAGARLEAAILKTLTAKYTFQYHALRDDRRGIENGIAIDWKY